MGHNVVMEVSVFLLVLAAHIKVVRSCLDHTITNRNHDEYDEEKVYFSDYVVVGEIGKSLTGSQYPYSAVRGVRTVEVTLTCVYKAKAPISNRTIHVTGVGNKNGELPGCPPAELAESQIAALFLKKIPGYGHNMFEIEYRPTYDDIPELLVDDITIVCGLSMVKIYDDDLCFEPAQDPDCVNYVPDYDEVMTPPLHEFAAATTGDVETTKEATVETTQEATVETTQEGITTENVTEDAPDNAATKQSFSGMFTGLIVFSLLYIYHTEK